MPHNEPLFKQESMSTWTKLKFAIQYRIKLIVISLILVTAGFYIAGYPVLAAGSVTVAWILITLFVSMSACLLSAGSKKVE